MNGICAILQGQFDFSRKYHTVMSYGAEYVFGVLNALLFGRFYACEGVIYAEVFILFLTHGALAPYLHALQRF